MIEERFLYALDNFLRPNYFVDKSSNYELTEDTKDGKSKLLLHVKMKDNFLVAHYDCEKEHPKCNFVRQEREYHMKKCIDHFVLVKRDNVWQLHMIEMKTSVGYLTWEDIKYKFRASYLNIKALMVFLGISVTDENIYTYTTYEKDCMNSINNDNPKILPQALGGYAIDPKREWNNGYVKIPMVETKGKEQFITVHHKKVKMKRSDENSQLEGELTI